MAEYHDKTAIAKAIKDGITKATETVREEATMNVTYTVIVSNKDYNTIIFKFNNFAEASRFARTAMETAQPAKGYEGKVYPPKVTITMEEIELGGEEEEENE